MARIAFEQTALTDSRFTRLGKLIKADKYAARGRMLDIWNECQEREVYALDAATIEDVHPDVPNIVAALIEAALASQQDDGKVYIHGTRGRIEWLSKKRTQAKLAAQKGGRPSTKTNNETVDGFNDESGFGLPAVNPPATATAPPPVSAPDPVKTKDEADAARVTPGAEAIDALRDAGFDVDGRDGRAVAALVKHHGLSVVLDYIKTHAAECLTGEVNSPLKYFLKVVNTNETKRKEVQHGRFGSEVDDGFVKASVPVS